MSPDLQFILRLLRMDNSTSGKYSLSSLIATKLIITYTVVLLTIVGYDYSK